MFGKNDKGKTEMGYMMLESTELQSAPTEIATGGPATIGYPLDR